MSIIFYYSIGFVLMVMLGSRLDRLIRLTHRRTQLLMSLISGVLLGIAVLHLLPHAMSASDVSIDYVAGYLLGGLLFMYFLQRLFHFHHHEYDKHGAPSQDENTIDDASAALVNDESDKHQAVAEGAGVTGLAGLGVILGLCIHSVVDGFALAVSIESDWHLGSAGLAGLSVFVAILMHKPLDALTLRFFMRDKGITEGKQIAVLLVYALICPIVVALLLLLSNRMFDVSPAFISAALAFSSGVFLCIALSDLLPEIHFHSHDRFAMTLALLTGVGLSLALGAIEPGHRHGGADIHQHQSHDHDKSVLPGLSHPH